ncbi:MAG: ATP-dependent DNA helicase RecQ [Planctomycetota bacterium]|nr:ATP-dependent DNA helicase RecQ [Planctomycetota bacterium]
MLNEIDKVLAEQFKLPGFRPGQKHVIEALLNGRSAAAVFPTGGGKSLCYQLPAVLLPGLTVVVSPLIALMKDQIDALAARGIAAERLDSTLTTEQYRSVMDRARSGDLRMLYVAPERFSNERFRESIRKIRVALFAVDEAHCISEWGHNFRPDYLKLPQFARLCNAERMLALTATATDAVLADICRVFQIESDDAVRTTFYRANLTIRMTATSPTSRDARLLKMLKDQPPGPGIIYVTLQKTAEELAVWLREENISARAYHAGLEDEERTSVQEWFLASQNGIVVATIAFGMGIDKANIRYVYHYNPPKSLENFAQEIGRAGRDGEPAICQSFLCYGDLKVLEEFAKRDTPTESAVASFVKDVFSLRDSFDVSLHEMAAQHGMRFPVVRTLLTYLELQEYLEGGTPFYSSYKFQPLKSSAQILARFEGERREFLHQLLRQAVKLKTWFRIDADKAARVIGCDRDRVIAALDYLHQQQMLELKAEGTRLRYRRLRKPDSVPALAKKLFEMLQNREARELARLQQVADLVSYEGCQVSALGAYFGEPTIDRCGHCTWCESMAGQPVGSTAG